MICLDTNAVVAAINGRPASVRPRLEAALLDEVPVGLPTVVLYELRYGIAKSARVEANMAALAAFLTLEVTPWPFEPEDAGEAGEMRAELERAGTPVGPYDILIAAQARRRDAVLVTANSRELGRVRGLRIENWSEG